MFSPHVILNSRRKSKVIQKTERGVQKNEQRVVTERIGALHWDDLDLLRGAAASTSLRQAANKLGVSINTVRSRIIRLEKALGTILFDRSRDGLFLTVDGVDVLDIALEMQTLRGKLDTGSGNNIVVNHGEINISCSEGIGEFWLMSMISILNERLPEHVISLHNDFNQERIHSRDHDISIGFSRPTDPDTIVTKLATIHFMLFASPDYLKDNGNPYSMNDLQGHAYVEQNAPGVRSDSLELFIGSLAAADIVALRVNTSHSLYRVIANGTAIGALPTFAAAMSQQIVPLDLPVQLRFDLWLSFSRAAKDSYPIRTTIDWLRECFNPDIYPWFADHFVHPRDFEPFIIDINRIDEFENMIEDL